MKFLKTLLCIPFSLIVAWLIQRLFIWLIPIAMNISWEWFILYILLAGGFVSFGIGIIVTILAFPTEWITNKSNIARIIATAVYTLSGVATVIIPWSDGISSFTVLQWIVAISLTGIIIRSYAAIIGSMFTYVRKDVSDNSNDSEDFDSLFNAMLEHEQNLPEELQRKLKDIMIYSPAKWKNYCASRELDYSPKYKIGFSFIVYNDENGKLISGRIIDIVFDYVWWKYKVDFDDEISIDNNLSKNSILLFESQLKGLINRTIKYSEFQYV